MRLLTWLGQFANRIETRETVPELYIPFTVTVCTCWRRVGRNRWRSPYASRFMQSIEASQ